MKNPLPPLPWSSQSVAPAGEYRSPGSVYIVDANGSKIALVFGAQGGAREKDAIAGLICAASRVIVPREPAQVIEDAYLALLQLPHGALRLRLQSVLATLRDEIAEATGKPSEEVQDAFEAQARG